MQMMVSPMCKIWLRARSLAAMFSNDVSGLAAVEFAMVVPLMLVLFFGTVEFSSGIAVDRKVSMVARTISDLTSQGTTVSDTDISNFGQTANAMMVPYSSTPLQTTISELYVDANLNVRVQWSKGSAPRATGSTVALPTALKVADTYLIWGEVSYQYVPTIGYVMSRTGIRLSDSTYTRPRQSKCVIYPTPAPGAASPLCPTS